MNEILEQIVLAARRRGPDWGNILFIVLMAIFWVIGGIFKAKKNAQQKRAGRQGTGSKPKAKSADEPKAKPKGIFQEIRAAIEAELQKQRESQQQSQQTRRKVEHPRPAVRRFSPQPEQITQTTTREPVKKRGLPSTIAEVEPKIEKIPEFDDKTVIMDSEKYMATVKQLPRSRYLTGILKDYSDPDELKRAILHYEILGRPLSLRDPSRHIIGL